MNQDTQPHYNKEAGKKKRHGIITYPDKIGPYIFKETIGEGAYSIVKLVYHEKQGKYYACKISPICLLKKGRLFERFELEIRISQIMKHPGVAAITDVLKDENNFYIFMEYYSNGNLTNYIKKRTKLPEIEAKGLIYQLFDALEYIKKQGVTHRDLKPDNIIIDNNGHIRISDFGLSTYVGEDNLVKTACGSPCYVSPEIIRGKQYDGFQTDVWSCGVILYSMVTGIMPWTKTNVKEIFLQIRIGDYQIPNYISEQCASLISMLLRVDPKKRITIDEAKHHTWFNIKTEEDIRNFLNYSIPTQFLNQHIQIEDNGSLPNSKELPYLSTKKVDEYFRPDVDYDFDSKFEDSNVHAINRTLNKTNCDVSSPEFKIDNVIKLLNNQENHPIKFRKRLSNQNDNNIFFDEYLKMKSNSAEKLPTPKILIFKNPTVRKEKSEILFKNCTTKTKCNNMKKNTFKFNRNSARLPKKYDHELKH